MFQLHNHCVLSWESSQSSRKSKAQLNDLENKVWKIPDPDLVCSRFSKRTKIVFRSRVRSIQLGGWLLSNCTTIDTSQKAFADECTSTTYGKRSPISTGCEFPSRYRLERKPRQQCRGTRNLLLGYIRSCPKYSRHSSCRRRRRCDTRRMPSCEGSRRRTSPSTPSRDWPYTVSSDRPSLDTSLVFASCWRTKRPPIRSGHCERWSRCLQGRQSFRTDRRLSRWSVGQEIDTRASIHPIEQWCLQKTFRMLKMLKAILTPPTSQRLQANARPHYMYKV